MQELLVLVAVSVFIAWLFTGLVVHFASHLKLVHEPNDRSSHETVTPHGGGISIVISTVCFSLWLIWRDNGSHVAYWAAIALFLDCCY